MGRELSHDEAVELLGAYALDALEPAEHQAVDVHVAACPACRMEVAEHREVAGLLTPGWGTPPAAVWDRIAASLEETPPALDMAPVIAMKPRQAPKVRRSFGAGIAAMVAVAAVAVIGVVGVRLIDDPPDRDYASQLAQSVDAALSDPGARRVQLASTDGRRSAEAVVLPDGTGYLVEANLPTLSSDRTYQMWAVVGTAKISVGVLGPEPGIVPFKMGGDVSALAITEEVAGGVVSSRQDPVVLGTVQRA
jgi:anti-sigma factor RsiW